MLTEQKLLEILANQFGHRVFRGEQLPVIQQVLTGGSALLLMPTGMGKSLCYQLPSVVLDGVTLVLSPLIALMQDQTDKAQQQGLKATFLSSTLSTEERHHRYQQIARGDFKLIYVTPERFRKEEFVKAMGKNKIALLAVDEAHCISQWGHDFRPDYSRLGDIRESLGNPPTVAMTATATPEVQKDIIRELRLGDVPVFHAGIERDNLALSVHDCYGLEEKIRGIVGLRYAYPGSALIYCSLIQTLYKVSAELKKLGIEHGVYHGQMEPRDRLRAQRDFIEGENKLMIATPAFGLGVDKPDVRLMIHAEVSNSLEAYYQEIGRAGRDGHPSQCHLFYDQEDVSIQMEFIKWANPDAEFVRQVYYLIKAGGPGLAQDGADFLRAQLNFYNKRDFRVETSLNLLERWGCLVVAKSKLGFEIAEDLSDEMLVEHTQKSRVSLQSQKLLEMVRFSTLEQGCRLQAIYHYFGHQSGPCGRCDLCQKTVKESLL